MSNQLISNQSIARVLEEVADLLEVQHADPHRVRAYRRGANLLKNEEEPVAELVVSGDHRALEALPGIGESLSKLIVEYVQTGRSSLLQRLRGEVSAEDLLEQVPGIGPGLAARIVGELDVRTLEELELAAHDGRLGKLPGFGKRRVEGILLALNSLLARWRGRGPIRAQQPSRAESDQPSVAALLDVDHEYREKAAAGQLRKIAPKRFNPNNEAWLPILHTERQGWDFTALFSNTSRAHELGTTHDWVVIFYDQDGEEGQATVVTENRGNLKGHRVVRGREKECLAAAAASTQEGRAAAQPESA